VMVRVLHVGLCQIRTENSDIDYGPKKLPKEAEMVTEECRSTAPIPVLYGASFRSIMHKILGRLSWDKSLNTWNKNKKAAQARSGFPRRR
jgi:hypothetical protein